mmetsp:Transcript_39192/g.44875  ORF Transcript_39192/g.44875 Transcript_39192/m.44875 type:complete len:115 (+) Transcript_39192:1658-2002(+)
MFTNKKYENGGSLKKCFTKCLKIASSAMKDAENLSLLVSILNKYIYFYMTEADQVSISDISQLIDLINENISQIKSEGKAEKAKLGIRYFDNTIKALKIKAADNSEKFGRLFSK